MSKTSKIQQLSPDIVAKIAAGEVVERPASVVKELLENSIDAQATKITVKIENAGVDLIEVTDNGTGMNRTEATLAFDNHTTSKIKDIADLFSIKTLGFRGEALSSIRAVSEIELTTSDGVEYTQISLTDKNKALNPNSKNISSGSGTTIQVRDLFKAVPARKKFLRSAATEFKYLSEVFVKHTISHPEIFFELFHNGRRIYALPATNSLKTRIFDLYGAKVSDNLIEINFDHPTLLITGTIAHPRLNRKDRNMQFLSLNSRPISSNLITTAIEDAYHSTLHQGYRPVFFIDLNIDPARVDVNVHPRKLEVKFDNTQEVFSLVKQAIGNTLSVALKNEVKERFEGLEVTTPKQNILYEKPARSYTPQYEPQYKSKQVLKQSLAFTRDLLVPLEDTQEIESEIGPVQKYSQFFNTYVLIEKGDKLFFIDQHAADERINYERLLERIEQKERVPTQKLLVPFIIDLTKAEMERITELKYIFSQIGIDISRFGQTKAKIDEIPTAFTDFDYQGFIEEVLSSEEEKIDEEKFLHELVAKMACHGSIRAGRTLSEIEMVKLVEDLFKCEKPYSCPHGRPVVWELTKYQIDKEFKRTGFC